MSDDFDPYYHWLGIPPHEQPPNYYRLLSLQLYEPHLEVIQNAVDRVMVHLRTFQTGKRSQESQQLLTEVSRAKLCLLDPGKKAEYDERLRAESAALFAAPPQVAAPLPAQVMPAEPGQDMALHTRGVGVFRYPRRRNTVGVIVALLVVLACLFAAPTAYIYWRRAADERLGQSVGGPRQKPESDPAPAEPNGAPLVPVVPPMKTDPGSQMEPPELPPPTSVPPEVEPPEAVAGGPAEAKPAAFRGGDVDAAVRAALEAGGGLVAEQHAMCQTVPLEAFPALAEQLRPYGYRPVRVRPYVADGAVLTAAMWVRDGAPWRLELARDAQTLVATAVTLAGEQYAPEDVAGYPLADEQSAAAYVGVFRRSSSLADSVEMFVGLAQVDQTRNRRRMQLRRFVLVAWQQFQDSAGEVRSCEIWHQQPVAQVAQWFRSSGAMVGGESPLAKLPTPFVPVDISLAVVQANGAAQVQWAACCTWEERPFAVVSGYDPERHRERCQGLSGQGYMPVSIGVVAWQGQSVSVSVWRFPARRPPAAIPMVRDDAAPSAEPEKIAATPPPDTAPPPVATRLAVPADAEHKAAIRQVNERYSADLSAAKTPAARTMLAQKMIKEADLEADTAQQYEIYEQARDLATQAGHVELAFEAIRSQASRFDVDPVDLKAGVVRKMLAAIKSRTARYALAWITFELSEQARVQESYVLAEQLASSAGNAARTIRDKRLPKAAAAQKDRITAAVALAAAAEKARVVLKQVPDDPDANLALGKYTCFVHGDWPTGLASLSRGSDAELARIAALDLENPTDAQQRWAVATAWAAWAQTQDGEVQLGALRRAVAWSARALPELAPELQVDAEQQLDQIYSQVAGWMWSGAHELPWFDGPAGTLREPAGVASEVTSLVGSTSGRVAVIGHADGTCRLWDLVSGRIRLEKPTLVTGRAEVVLADDGPLALCAGGGKDLTVWSLNTGSVNVQSQPYSVGQLAGAQFEAVYAWTLRTSQKDNVVVWNVGNRGRPQPLSVPGSVQCLTLSPDGRVLLVITNRDELISIDWSVGRELGHIQLNGSPRSSSVSPDGRFVAVGGSREITLFSALTGNVLCSVSSPKGEVAFLPGTELIVVDGDATGELAIWNVVTGLQVHSVNVQIGQQLAIITAISGLPDPRAVLVGTSAGDAAVVRLPDAVVAGQGEPTGASSRIAP